MPRILQVSAPFPGPLKVKSEWVVGIDASLILFLPWHPGGSFGLQKYPWVMQVQVDMGRGTEGRFFIWQILRPPNMPPCSNCPSSHPHCHPILSIPTSLPYPIHTHQGRQENIVYWHTDLATCYLWQLLDRALQDAAFCDSGKEPTVQNEDTSHSDSKASNKIGATLNELRKFSQSN